MSFNPTILNQLLNQAPEPMIEALTIIQSRSEGTSARQLYEQMKSFPSNEDVNRVLYEATTEGFIQRTETNNEKTFGGYVKYIYFITEKGIQYLKQLQRKPKAEPTKPVNRKAMFVLKTPDDQMFITPSLQQLKKIITAYARSHHGQCE